MYNAHIRDVNSIVKLELFIEPDMHLCIGDGSVECLNWSLFNLQSNSMQKHFEKSALSIKRKSA